MQRASADAVEAVLYGDRSLLRFHAMRRTVWVSTPSLVEAMNASSTRKIAENERRLLLKYLANTDGVSDPAVELDRLYALVVHAVASAGSITTRELGKTYPELTKKITIGFGKGTIDVGAHTRAASLAGFEGRLIRGRPTGTWVGSEYAWHCTDDWTDIDLDALDERDGMAMMARAYLSRFGPVTTTDLRWWTGWTAGAVKRALDDIDATEVSLDEGSGWVCPNDPLLDGEAASNVDPWVAVLPSLDPTTMGWKERAWYLDEATTARVFDRNGNAGPTIWCNGQVVGGWTQRPDGELRYELTHELDASAMQLLHVELARMTEAIGDIRFRVRFPSPNQLALLE